MSRRTFLATGGLALGGLTLPDLLPSKPEEARMLIIDCHAHIYGEDEKKYPPIDKPYRPPKGTGTLGHLRREMKNAAVGFVTAIQTSTFYRWDNRFTADSARTHREWIAGVVTLDPDDERSPGLLERYVRNDNVRGLRSIPAASGKLDDPGVAKLWEKAQQLGIVVNVLINRDKSEEMQALMKRFPKLRVVIDHCLNLKAGPDLDKTLAEMVRLAKHSNLHAKLSFVPTGSAREYPFEDMHDACRDIIKAYKANRCVWGSDFPCELWCPKATYAQHLKVFTRELKLEKETQEAILGKTAEKLWFAREARNEP
jgi:predicted TIM-barrel fold metal-dependent hydrolase